MPPPALPDPSVAPIPADQRPLVTERYHTADLPPTPQRDRRLPAELWVECPAWLGHLGDDIDAETVAYKRRIGSRWLLWRAGPAVDADARYGAVDADALDDPTRFFTYRLFPDGTGEGIGPDGITHTRFRTWKESLRDN
jgi:hypothetical protein